MSEVSNIPLQPTQAMIDAGKKELSSLLDDGLGVDLYEVDEMLQRNGESVEDRIVFIWQAMVQELNKSK